MTDFCILLLSLIRTLFPFRSLWITLSEWMWFNTSPMKCTWGRNNGSSVHHLLPICEWAFRQYRPCSVGLLMKQGDFMEIKCTGRRECYWTCKQGLLSRYFVSYCIAIFKLSFLKTAVLGESFLWLANTFRQTDVKCTTQKLTKLQVEVGTCTTFRNIFILCLKTRMKYMRLCNFHSFRF